MSRNVYNVFAGAGLITPIRREINNQKLLVEKEDQSNGQIRETVSLRLVNRLIKNTQLMERRLQSNTELSQLTDPAKLQKLAAHCGKTVGK